MVAALHVLAKGIFVLPPADHDYFTWVAVGSPHLQINESLVGFHQSCAPPEGGDEFIGPVNRNAQTGHRDIHTARYARLRRGGPRRSRSVAGIAATRPDARGRC